MAWERRRPAKGSVDRAFVPCVALGLAEEQQQDRIVAPFRERGPDGERTSRIATQGSYPYKGSMKKWFLG